MALAVTVARQHVYDAFLSMDAGHALMHGPTYSGNPLACAAANASIGLFRSEPRLAQVAAIEQRLRQGLAPCADMPGVADVRVLGAIGVVELEGAVDHDALRLRFVELGVWVRPFGRIVYLMPALNIPAEDLDRLIDAVVDVVGSRGALSADT